MSGAKKLGEILASEEMASRIDKELMTLWRCQLNWHTLVTARRGRESIASRSIPTVYDRRGLVVAVADNHVGHWLVAHSQKICKKINQQFGVNFRQLYPVVAPRPHWIQARLKLKPVEFYQPSATRQVYFLNQLETLREKHPALANNYAWLLATAECRYGPIELEG